METNEKLTEVLNDLIKINNDRIQGYEKAAEEAKDVDVDLKAIFANLSNNSKRFATELTHEVISMGGKATTETTTTGSIYRVWMDVKKAFATNDRQAILESCEFGEDAAQKAYNDALASDAEMSADIRRIITGQQAILKIDHDLIKKYRDLHKAMNA